MVLPLENRVARTTHAGRSWRHHSFLVTKRIWLSIPTKRAVIVAGQIGRGLAGCIQKDDRESLSRNGVCAASTVIRRRATGIKFR